MKWDFQGLDRVTDPLPQNLAIPIGERGFKEKKSIGVFKEN